MKIINHTYPINTRPISPQVNQYGYLQTSSQDVFVKTSPSFKQKTINFSKLLLGGGTFTFAAAFVAEVAKHFQNPAEMIADVTASLLSRAEQEQNSEEEPPNSVIEQLQDQLNAKDAKIEELCIQGEKNKAAIERLNALIKSMGNNSGDFGSGILVDPTDNNETFKGDNTKQPSSNEKYTAKFPPRTGTRTGRLPRPLEELKKAVKRAKLNTNESALQIEIICQKLISEESFTIDDKNISSNELAKNITTALIKNPIDYEEIKKVHDSIISNITSASDTEDSNVYKTPNEQPLPGLTVKGHIDLDGLNRKKKTDKKEEKVKVKGKKENRQVKRVTLRQARATERKNKEHTQQRLTTTSFVYNQENGTYTFNLPGTPSQDIRDDLRLLLLSFEKNKTIKELSNNKWMYRQYAGNNVSELDITTELESASKKNAPFKNINNENAYIVKDAINEDKRFNELFTLHAAMRLIDRFANFSDETGVPPIEEQCHNILDQLYSVIRKSLKEVTVVPYQDTNHGAYGAKLQIPTSLYDDAEREVFGSFDINLTVCEYQQAGYYDKRIKEPIISTIFFKIPTE